MATKPFVVLAVLAFGLLAGCSDAPPSGTLTQTASGLAVDGTVEIDYTAEERPAGTIPEVGGMLCPPEGSPEQIPQCVNASSTFMAHFMALPTPSGDGYTLVLVNATGELPLGALQMDEANMWELAATLDEDLTSRFDAIELRMGSFVYATAPTAEGPQTFALADGLSAVSATVSYRGKVLNVTVSGLPEGATYSGYLYSMDEESGLLTRGSPFAIANGANEHTAELNIDDYAEFHIHVGTSMVNLYKATVG